MHKLRTRFRATLLELPGVSSDVVDLYDSGAARLVEFCARQGYDLVEGDVPPSVLDELAVSLPETSNVRLLIGARRFLDHLRQAEGLPLEPCELTRMHEPASPGEAPVEPVRLTRADLDTYLRVAAATGEPDSTLMRLIPLLGLRASVVSHLTREQVDLDPERPRLLLSKGKEHRLDGLALTLLRRFLAGWHRENGGELGYLFPSPHGGEPLTPSSLTRRVKRIQAEGELPEFRISALADCYVYVEGMRDSDDSSTARAVRPRQLDFTEDPSLLERTSGPPIEPDIEPESPDEPGVEGAPPRDVEATVRRIADHPAYTGAGLGSIDDRGPEDDGTEEREGERVDDDELDPDEIAEGFFDEDLYEDVRGAAEDRPSVEGRPPADRGRRSQGKRPRKRLKRTPVAKFVPNQSVCAVRRRRPDGTIEYIRTYSDFEFLPEGGVEPFLRRYVLPEYGPGTYLLYRNDTAERAFATVRLAAPLDAAGAGLGSGDVVTHMMKSLMSENERLRRGASFPAPGYAAGGLGPGAVPGGLPPGPGAQAPYPVGLPAPLPAPAEDPFQRELLEERRRLREREEEQRRVDREELRRERERREKVESELRKAEIEAIRRVHKEAAVRAKATGMDRVFEFAESDIGKQLILGAVAMVTASQSGSQRTDGSGGSPPPPSTPPPFPARFPGYVRPLAENLSQATTQRESVEAFLYILGALRHEPEWRPWVAQLLAGVMADEPDRTLQIAWRLLKALSVAGYVQETVAALAVTACRDQWEPLCAFVRAQGPSR